MTPQNFLDPVSRRTKKRVLLGLAITKTWLLSPSLALAEAPRYEVELSVAPSLPACDRKAEFLALLLPLVPEPALDPPANRKLAVTISKTLAGAYGVDLAMKGIDGTEIRSTHSEFPANMACFEVLYWAAVRSASEIQRDLPLSSKPAPTPTCPAPPPPAAPPQCPPPEPPKAAPPKPATVERNRFIGAGGAFAWGVAPEVVIGAHILLGWKWAPSWSFEVDAGATLPNDTRPAGPTIVRIYTVGSIALAPCYRVGSLGACGVLAGNALVFEAIGVRDPQVGAVWSLALGGRGFLDHRLSDRWSARVNLDLVVPFARMEIGNVSQLRWAPTPIAGSFGASVLAWF